VIRWSFEAVQIDRDGVTAELEKVEQIEAPAS
jgi:hypothetical protein